MKRRTSRIQPPGRLAIVLLAALIALPATPRVAKAEGLRAADADGTHATQADSPRAEWQLLAGPVDPPPMYGHVALHDPVRHRMVFVNGARAGELWCLSLPADGHPAWSRQPIGGPEYPGSRYNFAAVYDSAGDRVIVFGGYRTWLVDYDDVWALTLGDAPRWTRIVTSGDGPHSRAGCAAAFDPVRRRLVIFGGYAYSGGQLGDTWALELAGTPAWHRLAAGGRSPLHREGAKAVYDPWNDRMVLFGGWVDGDYSAYPPPYYISDETWALPLANPASWDSLVIPVRPSPRQTFLAAVDREHRVMLVSGGEGWQDGHERADTWALRLDGTPAWSQVSAGGSGPGPVSWHAGDYSPERASLIQYGGIWTAVQSQCFELALDTDQWSQVLPEGPDPAPARRGGAMLLADPDSDRMLLWGGYWWHDLWSFDSRQGPRWTHLATEGIAPTAGAPAFVYDPIRRRIIGLGGGTNLNRGARLNQVWAMPIDSPRVWTPLAVQGESPVGRSSFHIAYDSRRDRLLVYGGINWNTGATRMANDLGDLWELSLAEPRWRQLQSSAAPGPRGGAQLFYDATRDRLLLLGGFVSGYDTSFPIYDTWAADLAGDSPRWSPLGPPLPGQAQIVLDSQRDRLVAWPGSDGAWLLPLAAPDAWQSAVVSGPSPTPRSDAGVMYDERADRLLVFGGDVFGGFPSPATAGDLYTLDFSRPVAVDVRPGDGTDVVPFGSHGLLETAILASATFSPESVLVASVTLSGARAFDDPRGRGHAEVRDVNHDGRADLVLRFPIDSLRLSPSDTIAVLAGETPNFAILGRGHVRVVGPGASRPGADAPAPAAGAPAPVRLALSVASPSMSGMAVGYSLPSTTSARLEVFDISGRLIVTRQLQPRAGEGGHVTLGPGQLRPGVYLLRLLQDGRVAHARAVVLR